MRSISILIFICSISYEVSCQDLLTKAEAINIALENNFDIRSAEKTVRISENNSNMFNSGNLPRISAAGGVNYSNSTTTAVFIDETKFEIKNAETYNYDASISADYVLFDGFGRSNIIKQFKENYYLNELQARAMIERTILTLFSNYHDIAKLTEQAGIMKRSMKISQQRKLRAVYSFEYGQATQLDLLNAQVDINNDSISYLRTLQELENSKRDLNLKLGRDISTMFSVDTNVNFSADLNLDNLMISALENNVNIEQAESEVNLSKYGVNANRSTWFPQINANGTYGWTKTDFGFNPNLNSQASVGPSARIGFNWNIFDGGKSNIALQNAKIEMDIKSIEQERVKMELLKDLNNAWFTYRNMLFILQAETQNLVTNRRNFERSNEQYKLGQISSLEFRQAQLNLVNARSNQSSAKYDAKASEVQLLQLSGTLLDAKL